MNGVRYSSISPFRPWLNRASDEWPSPILLAVTVTAISRISLADRIEDLLPQTQCTKCGYAACRPYAEAIANGEANYNQCPPGGMEGVARLASLLGKPVIPINPANGVERPRPL